MSISNSRLPLNALRTFEAAARHLSFKAAAAELCVSATTVSNQIRKLESDWGCQLFVRKTRAVVLTEAGRSLAQTLARAFASIRAEIDAHVAASARIVEIAVGPIFGARWLVPRLQGFRAQHPRTELILHHAPRITGIDTMPTAIAVDWGRGEWPGLDVQRLFEISYAPVVSPRLLATMGPLQNPADLARFPVIHHHDRGEWRNWQTLAGIEGMRFLQEVIVTDSNTVLQAALDGQGVALGIFPFIQGLVDSGQLVRPFALPLHPDRAYHLLMRPGALRRSEVSEVVRWLTAEAMRYRQTIGLTLPSEPST